MTGCHTLPPSGSCALVRFWADQSGATAIEYAMIASGVAVAIAATVYLVGNSVKDMFTRLSDLFPSS